MLGRFSEPRAVVPRGDLAAFEQSTITVFNATRDSVVFITTAERVVDPWTRNAYDVPRGNGSGFVWDELGHVVTNNHVIAGASRASLRWTRLVRQLGGLAKVDLVCFYAANRSVISAVA